MKFSWFIAQINQIPFIISSRLSCFIQLFLLIYFLGWVFVLGLVAKMKICIVGMLNAKNPVKVIVIRVCWSGYCGPRVNWHLLCSSKMTWETVERIPGTFCGRCHFHQKQHSVEWRSCQSYLRAKIAVKKIGLKHDSWWWGILIIGSSKVESGRNISLLHHDWSIQDEL